MYRSLLPRILFLILLSSSTLSAQSKPYSQEQKEARVLFEQGMALSEEGKWAEALAAFQKAYTLNPLPVIRYNIAFNLRALGRYVEAKNHLAALLKDMPTLKPPLKKTLQEDIKQLHEEVLSKLVQLRLIVDPPDAEIQIDGSTVAWSEQYKIELDPGKHVFVLKKEGYETTSVSKTLSPSDTELSLKAPQKETKMIEVVKTVERSEPPERPLYRRFWFWTATGAALVGGGVVLYLVTRPSPAAPREAPPLSTVDRSLPTVLRF
jgi:tetratricopeptide (TPR) repeat protein